MCFRIYGYDDYADSVVVSFYLIIPETLSLTEKLKELANKLKKYVFQNHPINLLRVENRDNKKIALIDLKEPDSSGKYTWRNGFFQGSSGGHATTIILIKTFLQEEYKGEWIDGVGFYYEGKPILNEDWDHISLGGIKYRMKR